jgi:hypothetical protein
MTRDGGLARLLLLLLLAVGVVSMHTLGHMAPGGAGSMSAMTASQATMHVMVPAVQHPVMSPAGSAGLPHHPLPGTDPMSVCLAVLGAFGLFAVFVLAARRAGTATPGPGGPPDGYSAGRAPPRHKCFAEPLVLRI